MSNVEIIKITPAESVNPFTEKVAELIAAQAALTEAGSTEKAAATFTEEKAAANKAAVQFAKAVNLAGHGARKHSVTDNGDGTVTYVFTLGKIRDLSKSKVEAEIVADEAATTEKSAKVDSAATGK